MSWFKKYRIAKLQEDLRAINAVIAAYEELGRKTATYYPISASENAEKKARIEFKLERLTK